ncbi:hypothetical protein KUTeg_021626 [Tegillarca granosa]|uniref:Uncharacterized protein n=1 Tax=Tegillarca granosa TaxID=220873 RepID=A0ABQ9E894_TEGGR|nr:hypothetical protein KUTeg_021626 [Tegillarca granosa]
MGNPTPSKKKQLKYEILNGMVTDVKFIPGTETIIQTGEDKEVSDESPTHVQKSRKRMIL